MRALILSFCGNSNCYFNFLEIARSLLQHEIIRFADCCHGHPSRFVRYCQFMAGSMLIANQDVVADQNLEGIC